MRYHEGWGRNAEEGEGRDLTVKKRSKGGKNGDNKVKPTA